MLDTSKENQSQNKNKKKRKKQMNKPKSLLRKATVTIIPGPFSET
jgi:hypothetical protein